MGGDSDDRLHVGDCMGERTKKTRGREESAPAEFVLDPIFVPVF